MADKNKKDLLIIIPAYNEEKTISSVIDTLSAQGILEYANVLVINDASKDLTNFIVKQKNCDMITNVFNLGYGSALQLGYKYAIRRRYRYVIQMDADGQHDVCNIERLYQELKKPDENGKLPDIVLGSRFMDGSGAFPTGKAKGLAISMFRFLIRLFTGRRIADPTTGLQGLNCSAALHYSKFGNFDDRYPDANMIVQMLLMGYEIREVPAIMHNRSTGASMHSGLKPIVYVFRMCMSILAWVCRVNSIKRKTGIKKDEIFY